jgi:hypothetical protein
MNFEGNKPNQAENRDNNAARQEALQNALAEVRTAIGEGVAAAVLPEDSRVESVTKDFFQSNAFKNAGFHHMPERYGVADRSLTCIDLQDGAQIFVVEGKVSNNNPFEIVLHAAAGGKEWRQSKVVVYTYDGDETITEYADGEANIYTGEYGRPDALLPAIREKLGEYVESESI